MNPLNEVLPPQVRKVIYAVLFVAALVWGAFQAADGDWLEFVGGLIVALTGAMAGGNVNTPELDDGRR